MESAASAGAAKRVAPAQVRVRYADTDPMGVAYYANYLAFFESGRVEALRQIGAEYAEVVRRGIHLPVIEATVRYRQPAYFDDLLLVFTHAANLAGARFTFVYEVHREADRALLASGHTVHACVDAQSLRPVRLPGWLRADLLPLVQPT
ncbi:MAG: acyl-CoA thioesterase [Chloroflexi bacterium]|nr:acyl-CoA thioesterase [Chloroflexota bacterium]